MGTTYLLMLHSDHRDAAVADELLLRSEAYLQDRGAKVIYGGGIRPLNAFYLGLYGGSELPGIFATDIVFLDACPPQRLSRNRSGARACSASLRSSAWPSAGSNGACVAPRSATRATPLRQDPGGKPAPPVRSNDSNSRCKTPPMVQPLSSVGFWDIEPLSTGWGAATAGMFDLHVSPEARRQGLATFLLGEAFNRLRDRGIVLVEAQTMRGNTPALAMYQKLGFQTVDSGYVFRKGA